MRKAVFRMPSYISCLRFAISLLAIFARCFLFKLRIKFDTRQYAKKVVCEREGLKLQITNQKIKYKYLIVIIIVNFKT